MPSVAGQMRSEIRGVLFHESTIMSRLDEMAAEISADYGGKEITVVTVLNGSLMFSADLLRRLEMPLRLDCLSVSSYHGASTTGVVTFNQLHLPDVHGRHVLLLDDILDSGHTLHAIRDKFLEETNSRRTTSVSTSPTNSSSVTASTTWNASAICPTSA